MNSDPHETSVFIRYVLIVNIWLHLFSKFSGDDGVVIRRFFQINSIKELYKLNINRFIRNSQLANEVKVELWDKYSTEDSDVAIWLLNLVPILSNFKFVRKLHFLFAIKTIV